VKIREAEIGKAARGATAPALKWEGSWRVPKFKHDVHLAAIARGPGVKEPFWPIPRPYQPSSPVWHSCVIGSPSAIRLDADGSGQFTPALEYATRLVDDSGNDFAKLVMCLADFDEAVAAQAARIVHVRRMKTPSELLDAATLADTPSIRNGFQG